MPSFRMFLGIHVGVKDAYATGANEAGPAEAARSLDSAASVAALRGLRRIHDEDPGSVRRRLVLQHGSRSIRFEDDDAVILASIMVALSTASFLRDRHRTAGEHDGLDAAEIDATAPPFADASNRTFAKGHGSLTVEPDF